MSKPGRNDPCPCGSGKKYKQCCIARDQDAAAAAAATARQQTLAAAAARREKDKLDLEEYEEELAFTEASNRVIDLINDGKLDDAEAAARDLLTRYPDMHDGLERLGAVCAARGNRKQAADYYRKAIAHICNNDHYDPDSMEVLRTMADKLDPPQEQAS